MKKWDRTFLIAALTSLTVLMGVSSWNYSTDKKFEKPTKEAVEKVLKKDQWRITNYKSDELSKQLHGYALEFYKDGSVLALKDNTIVNGTWSMYHTAKGRVKLNFEFPLADPFININSDWIIVESSDVELILENLTTTSEEGDKLTLKKV